MTSAAFLRDTAAVALEQKQNKPFFDTIALEVACRLFGTSSNGIGSAGASSWCCVACTSHQSGNSFPSSSEQRLLEVVNDVLKKNTHSHRVWLQTTRQSSHSSSDPWCPPLWLRSLPRVVSCGKFTVPPDAAATVVDAVLHLCECLAADVEVPPVALLAAAACAHWSVNEGSLIKIVCDHKEEKVDLYPTFAVRLQQSASHVIAVLLNRFVTLAAEDANCLTLAMRVSHMRGGAAVLPSRVPLIAKLKSFQQQCSFHLSSWLPSAVLIGARTTASPLLDIASLIVILILDVALTPLLKYALESDAETPTQQSLLRVVMQDIDRELQCFQTEEWTPLAPTVATSLRI